MSPLWSQALRRAALPGATKVTFEKRFIIDPGGQSVMQYRLHSLTDAGQPIGDDRDYDLLKAVMTPLEQLANQADHEEFMIELDLDKDLVRIHAM